LELYQQVWEPDVLHRIKPSCGSHAQSAGEIGFAAAGGTQQDDVVVLLDVVAGAEPQQFLLFQTSVGQILHILQTGARIREGCLPDQLVQMVILSGIPFRIHQKTEPVLKGHALELRIGKLVLQRIGHTPICMDLYASDFLPKPEVEGTLQVFADADCVYTGHHIFLVGGLQKLLHLELALPKTGNARAVTLHARFSFGSQTISISWQVWLYPHVRPTFRPEVHLQDAKLATYLNEGMVRSDTYVTDTLDETVFRELQNHRTVLLFYTYGAEQNRWQFPGAIERFKPCIWDRGSNLGGIVRNPMLQNALATDRFFNLNLQPILENGSKVNLDHFPCTAEMHVLGIDKPARDRLQSLVYGNKKFIDDDTLRRFSHLFSVKVDGGLLIVCTFRVTDTDNPVTSNLLSALLDHTENMDTNCAISAEELREWLDKINKVGMRREDIMNHFWELDNKPVEDSLFWEEYGINLADLR
jgi:hypothetical protein